MKTKWYLGALIVILALFGVSQDNLMVPNQEVVLQFSNTEVSLSEKQLAIASVKEQLEIIGVAQVEISNVANGRLVISYYSNTTVANVKDLLFTASGTIDYTSKEDNRSNSPTNQTYNLDVFEITKSSDTGFGSGGKLIFELKQDYDRFSNPNVYVYASEVTTTQKQIEIAVAYKQSNTIAIAINNIPHKIPEGRAGPVS
jgi:hypothetical protein